MKTHITFTCILYSLCGSIKHVVEKDVKNKKTHEIWTKFVNKWDHAVLKNVNTFLRLQGLYQKSVYYAFAKIKTPRKLVGRYE